MMKGRFSKRIFLIAPAALSLLAAIDAGLLRLGWVMPLPHPDLLLVHGPLMVGAFLGTLVSLERAVAIKRGWAYAGPLSTAVGGLWLILSPTAQSPRFLYLAGSLVLVVITVIFFRRQPTLYNACVASGALAWTAGNGLWSLGWPYYVVVPFWMGFLLLTIAGERLELSRLLRLSTTSRVLFNFSSGLFVAGLILAAVGFVAEPEARIVFGATNEVYSSVWFGRGTRLMGAGLWLTGLWLVYYDMARRSLRKEGLPRFMGVSLLLGYGWLIFSGLLWTVYGPLVAGPAHDAVLHTFFLGFVFGMIFAHAPVIFPAVLKRSLDFHPVFYTHLALLQIGLMVRIGGDLTDWFQVRSWGGMANALALVLFLANTVYRVLKGRPL